MRTTEKQVGHTPGPVSRFALYRGQWIVMQANIDAEDQRADKEWSEEASVYVPNAVAAAAQDLLDALRQMDALVDSLWKSVPWGKTFDLDVKALNEAPLAAKAAIARAEGTAPGA